MKLFLILFFSSFNILFAQLPYNPCKGIFEYIYDGYEWQGVINLDSVQEGQTRLDVDFVVEALVDQSNLGKITNIKKNPQINQPAKYTVTLPSQNPLPKLLKITVNRRDICVGRASKAKIRSTINLHHTLKLKSVQTVVQVPAQSHRPQNNQQSQQQSYQESLQQSYQQPQSPQHQPAPSTIDDYQPQTQLSNNNNPINRLNEVCGKQSNKKTLSLAYGGFEYSPGSWPWLVAIIITEENQFKCGGTLISAKTVVTAAHCYQQDSVPRSPSDILVLLGRHNINSLREHGSITSPVSAIYIHPDWPNSIRAGSFDADIALTILQKNVRFTRFVKPACLWSPAVSLSNTEGSFAGWGADETGEMMTSIPKMVISNIVSQSECVNSHADLRAIVSRRTFCAGKRNGEGPCTGDSGSGFLVRQGSRWFLRGIVSAALGDEEFVCNLRQYQVFTDVAKFLDFISYYAV